jgi:phage shock protein E
MKSFHAVSILAGAAFLLAGCSPDGQSADATQAAAPVSATAGTALEAGIIYLDVRTPEEYAAGHVQGAVHIPYDEVTVRSAELASYRDRDIVVYCKSGRRAGIAIDSLQAAGFTRLSNGGGLDELARQRNLPVETGSGRATTQ